MLGVDENEQPNIQDAGRATSGEVVGKIENYVATRKRKYAGDIPVPDETLANAASTLLRVSLFVSF